MSALNSRCPGPGSLLVLLIAFIASACASLQQLETPDVVLINIQPLQSTMLEQRFEVTLRLYNPNNKDIEIDGLDFELDLNGRRLARGVGGEPFVLPRLGEATTTVTTSTSLLDMFRQALALSETDTLSYRLRGRVHLAGPGGTLSFDRSGELAQRQTGSTL